MNKNIILMGLLLGAQSINASWWGCCGDAQDAVRLSPRPDLGQMVAIPTLAVHVVAVENNQVMAESGQGVSQDQRSNLSAGSTPKLQRVAVRLNDLDFVLQNNFTPRQDQQKDERVVDEINVVDSLASSLISPNFTASSTPYMSLLELPISMHEQKLKLEKQELELERQKLEFEKQSGSKNRNYNYNVNA